MTDERLWLLDDDIVPMHHHSGDDSKDFLVSVEKGRPQIIDPSKASERAVEKITPGEGVKRRSILASTMITGAAAMIAPSIAPRAAWADTASTNGGTLVVVFLRGGFDGLTALAPVGDSNYLRRRPTVGVRSPIMVDSFWGLHPEAKPLDAMRKAGELAFVHSSGNTDPTRSHFDSQFSMERGAGWSSKAASVSSGWLGRWMISRATESSLFASVALGHKQPFSLTAPGHSPLTTSSIRDFELYGWSNYLPRFKTILDDMYRRSGDVSGSALRTLASIEGLSDLRTSMEYYTPDNDAVYPSSETGTNFMQTAALIKAGKRPDVVCIDIGDWDMHADLGSDNDPDSWFARKLRDFAETLTAFRLDLGAHWNSTTVVTMSEFGRRIQENSTKGLDHGHGNVTLIAGGDVKGGVYGRWLGLEPASLDQGDLAITTDYRRIMSEIVVKKFGSTDLSKVFPYYVQETPLGVMR